MQVVKIVLKSIYVRIVIDVYSSETAMKQSILCAIDFSESSIQALGWAIQEAIRVNAQLVVLYSYRLIYAGNISDIYAFKEKTEEEARKKFQQIELQLKGDKILSTSFITEIGFFSDNIENYVRKNSVSMIVLGKTMADTIYEHKGLPLQDFMATVLLPLSIVPATSVNPVQASFA